MVTATQTQELESTKKFFEKMANSYLQLIFWLSSGNNEMEGNEKYIFLMKSLRYIFVKAWGSN